MFQSTPVITDGRTGPLPFNFTRVSSFNPHPSLLTGEPASYSVRMHPGCFNPHPSLLTGERFASKAMFANTFLTHLRELLDSWAINAHVRMEC